MFVMTLMADNTVREKKEQNSKSQVPNKSENIQDFGQTLL